MNPAQSGGKKRTASGAPPCGIDVEIVDGRPRLIVVDVEALAELAALVHRANEQRVYQGHLPIPSAAPFVRAARRTLALAQMVPTAEPGLVRVPDTATSLVPVSEAARRLPIGARAIRKRIAAGTLPAHRVGGCWLIDERDLA